MITINRPEAKNALNLAVAQSVAAAVDELDESDELRVGVLTGAGGTFSAGMDLKAFLAGEAPTIEGRGLCGITHTPPRKPLVPQQPDLQVPCSGFRTASPISPACGRRAARAAKSSEALSPRSRASTPRLR